MIPAEWQMPVVVLGLLIGLLFAASLVSKYQAYKAQQRATIRRIGSAIPIIENALVALSGVPLSQALRVVLRNDVYQRYLLIGQTMASYPNLSTLQSQAKTRLDAEGASQGASVGPVEDEGLRKQWLGAIAELLGYLEKGGPVTHLRTEQRMHFLQELKERRAEINARYFIVLAHRSEEAGDLGAARKQLGGLMALLKEQGPNTEFVRALYAEAEALSQGVGKKQNPPEAEPDVSVEAG